MQLIYLEKYKKRKGGQIMEGKTIEDLANKNGLTVEQLKQIAITNQLDIMSSSLEDKIKKIITNYSLNDQHRNNSALKAFEIQGLFQSGNNYKFTFTDDINIFVSENGVGKTTILKLLIAVIENDYETLNEIYFDKITLTINKNTYSIDKKKICENLREEYFAFLNSLKPLLTPNYYISLINDFEEYGKFNLSQFETYFRNYPRVRSESFFTMRRSRKELDIVKNKEAEMIKEQLGAIQEDIRSEILFYPTYRKIEAPQEKVFLTEDEDIEIFNKYISFGMNDVKQQIHSLLQQLRSSTNRAYSEINSKIINDLATKDLSKLIQSVGKIDTHKFDVVINRIGKDNITCYDKLKSFVEGAINDLPNGDFLKYYINKLISIYDNQKPLSDRLSRFTEVCNKYLVNKEIIYNESTLQVDILSKDDNNTKIDIDDLSSGEKQIVSIFSKVYLDLSTPSIFVIDEPEISLSIEWQKQFLIDIYNSKKISLMIATTHSPFIFKNEFRDFTKDMDIYRK